MHVGAAVTLSAVESAVRTAASATGVDFSFLMRTAQRESGYNPFAQATNSSAAGLFQFVEQTWLATLKHHGASHGYARYAGLIQQGSDGRYFVAGEEAHRTVMDLRLDPGASATMAGELAGDHAAYLRGRVGREPTGGELYAAHFLGPQGSARLIEATAATPNVHAASLFPEAAASNHNVFYRNGQPRSVSEVLADLNATGGGDVSLERRAAADPGQEAFAAYAGAGRNARQREQQLLVDYLLRGGGSSSPAASPASSLFSTELLSVLSDEQAAATQPVLPMTPVASAAR